MPTCNLFLPPLETVCRKTLQQVNRHFRRKLKNSVKNYCDMKTASLKAGFSASAASHGWAAAEFQISQTM
jgi:hypothetical protein